MGGSARLRRGDAMSGSRFVSRIAEIDSQLAYIANTLKVGEYKGAGMRFWVQVGANEDDRAVKFDLSGGEEMILDAMRASLIASRTLNVRLARAECDELRAMLAKEDEREAQS